MKDLVQRVLKNAGSPEYLAHTPWRDAEPSASAEGVYATYRAKFAAARRDLEAVLGDAERALPRDAGWFQGWYPEAFAAAAWWVDSKWLCLAAEHHDRETPVALLVRVLTEEEIEALGQ